MEIGDFHFLRPLWLLALVPLLLLAWRLVKQGEGGGIWQSICDEALLPYLLVKKNATNSRLNLFAFSFIGGLGIVALAGPTWERLPAPVFRDESALVILLDMSRSMDAADVSPTRLDRAKFKITDLLRERHDGQTALIVYAAQAYVVTPLTDDVATIEAQLPALKTNIMPSQGSNASAALEKALDLLSQAGMARGEVLLVTDGLGLVERERAQTVINKASARISILGVGTAEGAPIPNQQGGFVQDDRGNVVLEPLKANELDALATAGRGIYQTVRTDDQDIDVFTATFNDELDRQNAATTDLFTDRWKEVGPWLLLGLLPFAPLAFRRGLLCLIAVSIAGISAPAPVSAGWWSTPDQSAIKQFEQGDYASAAETFDNESWRAAAHYRAGEYDLAAQTVPDDAGGTAQYNKGNALARQGKLEEAIAAYEQTLSEDPAHEDALYNKTLLEKILEEQKEEQPEQQSEASDDANDESDSGQGGGNQSGEQSSQENADSESQQSNPETEQSEEQQESSTSAENEEGEESTPEEAEQSEATDESNDNQQQAQPGEQAQAQANTDMENDQATEQWLRQIPDDPGGLLRRKFEHEYQTRYRQQHRRSNAW